MKRKIYNQQTLLNPRILFRFTSLIVGLLLASMFYVHGQNNSPVLNWQPASELKVNEGGEKAIPSNPIIKTISSKDENASLKKFELVEFNEGYALQINSPNDKEKENEVVLSLKENQSSLIFTIENIYNFRTADNQENKQFIEVYGENDLAEKVYPSFFIDESEEGHYEVKENTIEIIQPEMNDILVIFSEPIHTIHFINKKAKADSSFETYFSLGNFRQIDLDFKQNLSDQVFGNVCDLEEVTFLLDASSSMQKEDRKELIQSIVETIQAINNSNAGKKISVNVYAFNNKLSALLTSKSVLGKSDVSEIQTLLEKEYLANEKMGTAWTNWSAASEFLKPNPKQQTIMFANGLPNGTTEKRTSQLQAFDEQLINDRVILVGLGDLAQKQSMCHFDNESYLEFLKGLSDVCQADKNSNQLAATFPNPFTNEFTIQFDAAIEDNVIVKLFDQVGKEVYSTEFKNAPKHIELTGLKLTPGLYQLSVFDSQNQLIHSEQMLKN